MINVLKTTGMGFALLTLVACGATQNESQTLTSSAPTFKNYDWDTSSGLSLNKKAESDGLFVDVNIDTFHIGETLKGKFLHEMSFDLVSYPTDGSVGYVEIKETFNSLSCVKSKYRPANRIRRFPMVTCDAVFVTDQRPEMIFGAPQVKVVMKQTPSKLVDVSIKVIQGPETTSYSQKGLKVDFSNYK